MINEKGQFVKIPLTIERIKSNCEIDPKTGCWNWKLSRQKPMGYGKTYSGKCIHTHRAVWELTRGPIPKGLCVLHDCDNPPCCNPEHLKLGTFGDNNREAFSKGRNPVGEGHSHAKLKAIQVLKVLKSQASDTELARRFGVTRNAIKCIRIGKSWKSVTGLRYET